MDKYQELAASIIDMVEYAIRKAHPKVDKVGSNCTGNTLLYGEVYYLLEDEIADYLKTKGL